MKFFGLSVLFLCLQVTTGLASFVVDNSAHALTALKSAGVCCGSVPSFLEISKKVRSSVPAKADAGKGAQRMPFNDFQSAVAGEKRQTRFYGGSLGIPFSVQDEGTTSSNTSEVLPSEQADEAVPAVEALKSPLLLQAPKPLEATAMMRIETLFFVQMLEQFHISKKKLIDLPTEEVLRSYVSALDGQKMIFTQTQVDWFVKEYRTSFELLWRAGSLTPGFLLADLYRRRLRERVQWILKRLEQPFDFSLTNTFIEDRKDAEFAPDMAALDTLWEQRLKHELINEMTSRRRDKTDELTEEDTSVPETDETTVTEETALENEAKARECLKEWYRDFNRAVQTLEASDIQELYCNSLSQFYDPHTNFLSADSMEDFAVELRNKLTGIGAVLRDQRGDCTIAELMPGGPAEGCGQLQAGDKILAVAQGKENFVRIRGLGLRRSVRLIRGKKGTVVRLLIQPADDLSRQKTVTLVRDEIKLEDKLAFAKIFALPDTRGRYHTIGWVDVPSFYGPESSKDTNTHSVSEDVRVLIERLKQFPVEGLILDMRRNSGGLLTEAVKLVGLFLNNASVVQVRGSGMDDRMYTHAGGCIWDGPLLVLTSRFSASAAEITAGALQSMRRALIFGAPVTHGKGSVQGMIEMDKLPFLTGHASLGAVKLTLQKWYLPDGSSIQRRGVHPDIAHASFSDCLPIGEADSPHALPWDCIEPMPLRVSPALSGRWLKGGILQLLLQRQHTRERERAYFDWYQRQATLFAKRYKQTEYSLNLKDRIARINEDRRLGKALADEEKTFFSLRYGYRLLTLGEVPHKSGKAKKPTFDFFEQEALDIMTDWVVALHVIPQFSLWCYVQKQLF